jgi:hypothetical protein
MAQRRRHRRPLVAASAASSLPPLCRQHRCDVASPSPSPQPPRQLVVASTAASPSTSRLSSPGHSQATDATAMPPRRCRSRRRHCCLHCGVAADAAAMPLWLPGRGGDTTDAAAPVAATSLSPPLLPCCHQRHGCRCCCRSSNATSLPSPLDCRLAADAAAWLPTSPPHPPQPPPCCHSDAMSLPHYCQAATLPSLPLSSPSPYLFFPSPACSQVFKVRAACG